MNKPSRSIDLRPHLSILESTYMAPGMSGYTAIGQSIAVAAAADECDYHRLWRTEHHAHPRVASSAPAVLVAHIAASTSRIRVGTGGVMLRNYSSLMVAEQFCTLEALYPGRIDLGIGGASGTPNSASVYQDALGRTAGSATDYPQRIDDLIGFVCGGFPAGHPYAEIALAPPVDAVPIFVLGSSVRGGGLAAERGLPFAFAHHLGVAAPGPVLRQYRASFRPSTALAEPYAIVSVGVVCAETDAAADQIAFTVGLTEVRRRQAVEGGAPNDAGHHPDVAGTPHERDLVRGLLSRSPTLIGDPSTVADGLVDLAARTGADELMVMPIDHDGPGRIRTLRLVAEGYRQAAHPAWALPTVT